MLSGGEKNLNLHYLPNPDGLNNLMNNNKHNLKKKKN